jgi:thiamine-phosphate pyrophosphorylase
MKKTILFSPPDFLPNEIPAVIALFQAGLSCLHVRKSTQNESEVLAYISQIPTEFHARLMLHNHHNLAQKVELKGLHFNRNQFINKNENYKNLFLSQSVHSFEEIKELDKRINYAFLSPIFDSISKENYSHQFEEMELRNFFSYYKGSIEIIALGGINAENAKIAFEYGFQGVAILGWIWEDFRENQSIESVLEKWGRIE